MKYPLIEIQTVPIEIQMKISSARLEYHRGTAQVEIQRDKGSLNIHSRPIKLNIDTFEARNSIVPTTMRSITQQAQRGQQSAYEATALTAKEGRVMMEAKIDQDVIPQLMRQRVMDKPANLNIAFLPNAEPDISWEGGEMRIQYEMDKLNFYWRMKDMSFTFVPGDIEISVTQQPDILIKYVGDPLYVPPSAAPGYKQIDVQA